MSIITDVGAYSNDRWPASDNVWDWSEGDNSRWITSSVESDSCSYDASGKLTLSNEDNRKLGLAGRMVVEQMLAAALKFIAGGPKLHERAVETW